MCSRGVLKQPWNGMPATSQLGIPPEVVFKYTIGRMIVLTDKSNREDFINKYAISKNI